MKAGLLGYRLTRADARNYEFQKQSESWNEINL